MEGMKKHNEADMLEALGYIKGFLLKVLEMDHSYPIYEPNSAANSGIIARLSSYKT